MKRNSLFSLAALMCASALAGGCSTDTNGMLVELAPDVVSSIDGTLHVRAMALADRTPVAGESIDLSVTYADRNGADHAIAPIVAKSDSSGSAEAEFIGLSWEGTGTVTARLVDGAGAPILAGGEMVQATASFSVLDRTPPTATILDPTLNLMIGPGLPIEVFVHVTDEIGVSQVILEVAGGDFTQVRTSVVASGSLDTTVRFFVDIPTNARRGPSVTLHALVSDLSSNQVAAAAVVLTVDPAIAIATPVELDGGNLLTNGDGNTLDDPTSLVLSPMDGMLYVADNSNNGPCNNACIRKVDPTSGVVDNAIVVNGNGRIEGVAVDATGDNLYYSDRQNRVMRMTWDTNTSQYIGAVACNDVNAQNPRDPYHLIFDEVLGILVNDQNDQLVKRHATCNINNQPSNFTGQDFNRPWGIARGIGEVAYVSDEQNDEIRSVDLTNGNTDLFEWRDMDRPRGIVWLDGGVSSYQDSLLVANRNSRIISSTIGFDSTRSAVYLRNDPVDVEVEGTILYILTRPSQGNPGRIFVVTGF